MIRFFKTEDIVKIKELGMQITPDFVKTNDLEKIKEDKFTKILVYEQEKEVIAFLMYTELEETIDIIDIIVEEKYRDKKIASCLLDYLISEMKESVKLMTLEVRRNNIPAIHLYEKFGFSIVNIRKKYYQDEDAFLMGRRIER